MLCQKEKCGIKLNILRRRKLHVDAFCKSTKVFGAKIFFNTHTLFKIFVQIMKIYTKRGI